MRSIVLRLMLMVLIVGLLIGCTSQAPLSPTPTAPPPLRIALVMKTLTNPFFVAMEQGARQAEKDLGINLIVKTAAQETAIEQQIKIVEDLITEKVKAIVIAPGDSQKLIPVLKKAQDAGIVIINIDNRLDPTVAKNVGLINIPFVSVNNEAGAYLSAKFVSDKIATPTQVAIIEGIRSAYNAQERKTGAERAFNENPNLSIVASETANWKIDEAYTVAKSTFEKYPHIGAVFCANDMMALGVIEYLKESKRNTVLVAAFDALEEAKEEILAGRLAVTIDQQAGRQGYVGVEYAVKILRGESVPLETMIDVLVVSSETLNKTP
ncbi:MAG: sugar ABC transporter substrate-binding protein [Anaerolineae bacterium]|nr:sugar ABC transporter substrate-binding protein [Anaerolineae bacterium]